MITALSITAVLIAGLFLATISATLHAPRKERVLQTARSQSRPPRNARQLLL